MSNQSYRPFIVIVLAFAGGIFLHGVLSVSFMWWVLLASLNCLLCAGFYRRKCVATMFLLIAVLCCGALYMQSVQTLPKNHFSSIVKYYYKKPFTIQGVIVSEVEKRTSFKGVKTTFVCDVMRVKTKWGWKDKSGKVLVNIFRDIDLSYGQDIELAGRIHRPFEFAKDSNFSYQDLLARKGITHILSVKARAKVGVMRVPAGFSFRRLALKVKHKGQALLNQALTANESALMRAILLGDRHDIPSHVRELFQLSGVAHVLAISGLHIGIVSFLFFMLLKLLPLPRLWQYGLTILLLVFYAFLTGGRVSVVRSTLMSSVFIASFIMEKETEVFNVLSLAALIVLLLNPYHLYDVGFQLSFLSVFSIVTLYPHISNFLKRICLAGKSRCVAHLIQSISVSLSAYLGVCGLIAYYFQIITPLSVLANIIVIPLIAVIVSVGMGLILIGSILPSTIFAFALCLKLLLNAMVAIIFLCVQIPGAYVRLETVSLRIVVYYYVLFFIVIFVKQFLGKVLSFGVKGERCVKT